MKKSKSWEPFWSYQLISTANPAQLPQNWPNWQFCLAGSSKRAPRVLIFSIAMGAEYLSYVKSMATFAPTFYGYNISVLASVARSTLSAGVFHIITLYNFGKLNSFNLMILRWKLFNLIHFITKPTRLNNESFHALSQKSHVMLKLFKSSFFLLKAEILLLWSIHTSYCSKVFNGKKLVLQLRTWKGEQKGPFYNDDH